MLYCNNIFKKESFKRMKLLLSLLFLVFSNSLFADYTVFTNKSELFSDTEVMQQEEIFFGELQEYQKSLAEIQKALIAHGTMGAINGLNNQSANLAKGLLGEGLKGAGTGIAIGLVVATLDPYVMSAYADQYYVRVYKILLKNGKTVFANKFLIGDSNHELSKEEVKEILGDSQ